MNELPVDLAPPLHLMESGGSSPWWFLLLPLLAFLLARWLRKGRPPEPPAAAASAQSAPAPRPSNLAAKIDALHKQYKGKSDYRRGCHELARLLRQHVTGTLTLTAREIANTMGEVGLSKIFPLLAELQFSREEPRRSDFSGICELAQEAARDGAGEE